MTLKLAPQKQVTLTQSGTIRKIITHGDFVYALTDKGLTGEIRKWTRCLKPIWGKSIPFSGNDMAVGDEGIVISGHQYSKGNEGISISTPMVAKMNGHGDVEWQRGPRPPQNIDSELQGVPEQFNPNASSQFWKTLLLPGGSVISMGMANQRNGQILYHHRFDTHGRTIWSKACAFVKTDLMYTYPGKIEPMMARYKEWLYHFGAYRISPQNTGLAGFKIHIRSGKVVEKYISESTQQTFSCGALAQNGDCAVGVIGTKDSPASIFVLDAHFKQKGELTTSLQPWADLFWTGPDEIAYAGGVNINDQEMKKPGFERFLVRTGSLSRPQLFEAHRLRGFARLSKTHLAFISEEKGLNHLTVRRLLDGATWTLSRPAMTHLQIDELNDGGAIVGLNLMGSKLSLISF